MGDILTYLAKLPAHWFWPILILSAVLVGWPYVHRIVQDVLPWRRAFAKEKMLLELQKLRLEIRKLHHELGEPEPAAQHRPPPRPAPAAGATVETAEERARAILRGEATAEQFAKTESQARQFSWRRARYAGLGGAGSGFAFSAIILIAILLAGETVDPVSPAIYGFAAMVVGFASFSGVISGFLGQDSATDRQLMAGGAMLPIAVMFIVGLVSRIFA